jgi:PKD repeat protein
VTVANTAPTPNFTFSPSAPLSGQTITFTSTSTDPDGTIAKIEWDLDGDSATNFTVTGNTATKSFPRPGTYPIRLRATDNRGATATVSKSVVVGNRPPLADFTFDPARPVAGQPVQLTSTAVDPDGTLGSQTWDLDNDGAFDDATGARPVWTPAAAGAFTVRLRVVDDKNAATVATKTIAVDPPSDPGTPLPPETAPPQSFDVSAPIEAPPVAAPVAPLRWLDPFPTIRMRGRTTRRGAQLTLLTVHAPDGALAEVRCVGRHCPTKLQRRTVNARKGHRTATVHLSRFERFLPAGVELQIGVTEQGMVGKYTRIKVRRLALPVRVDRCLLPGSAKPAACPPAP